MSLFGSGRHTDKTPENSPGGPTYDARIDPAIDTAAILANERLIVQRDAHLYGDKTAPADLYSHYLQTQPSPVVLQMNGLAQSRDAIEKIVQRKDLAPFPGVALGHTPGFHAAPDTSPVLGANPALLAHHAHQIESKRATRYRFGH